MTSYSLLAQDGMGIGNANPQEMLDVSGAIKIGGTLVGAADAGSIRWNGTNFQGYNGTIWVNLDGGSGADTDWTISGVNQYSGVSGNVGIGTTNPTSKLEVAGQIKITGGSPVANRVLTSDATGLGTWTDLNTLLPNDADWTVSGSNQYSAVTGNVGIGTSAPSQKLEVNGAGAFTGTLPAGNTSNGVFVDRNEIRALNGVNGRNLNVSGQNLIFKSGLTYAEQMRLDQNGNVGIGTSSPDVKLELYTGSATTEMYITKDGSQSSSLLFRNGVTGAQGTSLGLNSAEHFTIQNNIADKDILLTVNDGGTSVDLVALDASAGRVGIGTTSPDYLLDVSGDMGVNNRVLHNGDPNTFLSFTPDRIQLFAGSGASSWIDAQQSALELAVNENGVNRDFRVEGGNDVNLLFVDGWNDMIGISTNAPSATLDVEGTFQLVDGTEGAGKILSSDATGLATWTDPNTLFATPIFQNTAAVTSNENGNYSSDDFVFGSPTLAYSGSVGHTSRFYHDKAKGAFRAGIAINEWDPVNVGDASAAFGWRNIADGERSMAWGGLNQALGHFSTAGGQGNTAASYAETVFGNYSTLYSATSIGSWAANDRLFVIGNGVTTSTRSNALTIYKNGTMNINDAYDMPAVDGTANQVMTTDGSGNVTWQTPMADGDGSSSNELQTLSQSGTNVTLSNGGGTISVADNDNSSSNELQTLLQSGTSVTLSNGGGTVSVADNDNSSTNEIQNLSSSTSGTNRTINISGGTGTTISVADNDNSSSNEIQSLSISGSTVSLSNGGGSVTVPNDGDWTVSGTNLTSAVSGSVGIGVTPTTKLDVDGNGLFRGGDINLWSSTAVEGGQIALANGGNNGTSPTDFWFVDVYNDDFRIIDGGNVRLFGEETGHWGIGTTDPIAPLHVEAQASAGYGNFTFYAKDQYTNHPNNVTSCCGGTINNISIHASGRVMAQEFDAFSDARIKLVEGHSNSSQDLNTLMGIEITDYRMKDAAKNGKAYKKVIAQQVESVYPQAVSTIANVIPDIYTVAEMVEGFVALSTDLEVGDKVRLVFEEETVLAAVTEAAEKGFKVDLDRTENVFVYGREVDDFRTVDYEAISMLNVSATQELVKRLNEMERANAEMQLNFSSLKAEIDELKGWTQFGETTNK